MTNEESTQTIRSPVPTGHLPCYSSPAVEDRCRPGQVHGEAGASMCLSGSLDRPTGDRGLRWRRERAESHPGGPQCRTAQRGRPVIEKEACQPKRAPNPAGRFATEAGIQNEGLLDVQGSCFTKCYLWCFPSRSKQ